MASVNGDHAAHRPELSRPPNHLLQSTPLVSGRKVQLRAVAERYGGDPGFVAKKRIPAVAGRAQRLKPDDTDARSGSSPPDKAAPAASPAPIWCGQVAAPNDNRSFALSRRLGARPSAPPIMKTSGRAIGAAPFCRASAAKSALSSAFAALIEQHCNGAVRNQVGERDRLLEHALARRRPRGFPGFRRFQRCASRDCGRSARRVCGSARRARSPSPLSVVRQRRR